MCKPEESYSDPQHHSKLSGFFSQKLHASGKKSLDYQEAVLRLFQGQDGQEEFFQMLRF